MSSEKIIDTSLIVSKIHIIENDSKLLVKTIDNIADAKDKEKIRQQLKSTLQNVLSLL